MKTIKSLYILLFLFGISFSNHTLAQKLMYSITDETKQIEKFRLNNNIGNVIVIYGNDIYPDRNDRVNTSVLRKAIISAFPERNAYGYGVLDWEGKAYHTLLYRNSSTNDFKNVLSQFLIAIRLAKELRPNVQWGFFNIPLRYLLFKNSQSWMNQNNNIDILLKEVDVFYPVFYPRSNNDIINKDFVMKLGEMKKKYKKKVVAFMWHRVEGKEGRYQKIKKDIFVRNAKILINSSNIDKVAWWSKDTYFYRNKNKVFTNEAKSLTDFNVLYENLIIDYSKAILK